MSDLGRCVCGTLVTAGLDKMAHDRFECPERLPRCADCGAELADTRMHRCPPCAFQRRSEAIDGW